MLKEIKERRSIRKYLAKDVPDELIRQLLESAQYAPSGSNTQPWRFLIVRNQTKKEQITMADHDQKWMLSAPVFIVCAADISARLSQTTKLDEYCPLPELKLIIRDTAIAIEHIVLEADHLGLGTCWTGWFDQAEMQKAVSAAADLYICAVLTVGYSAENPSMRPRKNLTEFVSYENW
ncbi:nitroreductase family protein [Pectinatus frisingensis]|uniref:nitroreductase family protein n=1 Tax=Pectinatus frisingensis TaxID=865 RepID=UPI0015F53DAC|nr:nitroreductase family protein [Pectinatus frisingensis]